MPPAGRKRAGAWCKLSAAVVRPAENEFSDIILLSCLLLRHYIIIIIISVIISVISIFPSEILCLSYSSTVDDDEGFVRKR